METTQHGWTVVDREAGVLVYEYAFTEGATANAFAARIKDESLLLISPPCGVSDEIYDDLTAFGKVTAVVANNGFHYLGQAACKRRFPDAQFFAAPETVRRIQKKSQDLPEFRPIESAQSMLGEDVGLIEVTATKCGETWAWVKAASGTIWFCSDTLSNIPAFPKNFFIRTLFKMTGTKTGFGVFHTALKFLVKDTKRTLAQLSDEMKTHPPAVIVPGHGRILADQDLAKRTRELIAAAL